MSLILKKISKLIFSYKKSILIIWLLLIVLSIINLKINKVENSETELSGINNTEAAKVTQLLETEFHQKLGSSAAIAIEGQPDTDELAKSLKERFSEISLIKEIKGFSKHNNRLLYIQFKANLEFVTTQTLSIQLREYLRKWSEKSGHNAYLTGSTAFYHDIKTAGKKDSFKGESFALLFSFFILIFNFGTLASAFLPLITGASTLILVNSLLRIAGLETNPISQVLTSLVGLALAIDYSLFIVSRFREEISLKNDARAALQTTLIYSGKTIIVSALIMLCSVSALLIPDVSSSRTVVINLMIVIGISTINSVLFLPALLIYGKDILEKPEFLSRFIKNIDKYSFWKKFATAIVSNPKTYFLISLILLISLSLPLLTIKLWEPVQTLAPKDSESIVGYNLLEKDGWGGELIPITIIAEAKTNQSVFSKEYLNYIYDFSKTMEKLSQVSSVQSITNWNSGFSKSDYLTFYTSLYSLGILSTNNEFLPLINQKKNLTVINIYSKNIMNVEQTYEIINIARDYAREHTEEKIYVGGMIARARDFTHELYNYIPAMLAIILVGIFIILFFYMKTIVLPIKAGIMNFLPILSSFGILTLIFQYGYLHNILNTPVNGAVTNMVPITLFCIIFGLSMDYEVLILSRISEAYEEEKNVKNAVIEGMARSGSVITGAALILLGVFIPGIFASSPMVKEICIGIVSAIIIDTTIVRLLLVPSFMMLMGKWNWWNPWKKLSPNSSLVKGEEDA